MLFSPVINRFCIFLLFCNFCVTLILWMNILGDQGFSSKGLSWVKNSGNRTVNARLYYHPPPSSLPPFEHRLDWLARVYSSSSASASAHRTLKALLRTQLSDWDSICDVGPAATPALWQSSHPIILSIAYPGWMGVYSAALGLGPVLGTYFDFTADQRSTLLGLLLDTPTLRSVVVHGMPPGTLELSIMIRQSAPHIKVFFVYHGALSAPFHVSAGEASLLSGILNLTQEGIVHSVGTVKYGFHTTLLALGSRRAFSVPNFPVLHPHLLLEKHSARDGLLHIGVLASSDSSHKNVIAQVIAACVIPGAVVHVTVLPDVEYLSSCKAQLVETGLLPHEEFTVEVTKMDVLLYVSLVECFPMMVLEGAAAGIPVLVSRTHHLFDSNPLLERALVVSEADSTSEISARLEGVASPSARAALRPHLLALAGCMQRKAELAWARFLELSDEERVQLDFLKSMDVSEFREATEDNVCGGGDGTASALDVGSKVDRKTAAQKVSYRDPGHFRVAFVTYELPPFLPGGAGVVINNLVEELLRRGYGVTLMVHASLEVVGKWTEMMRKRGWDSDWGKGGTEASLPPPRRPHLLAIHHIPTLAEEGELSSHPCAPRHIFLRRSSVFAEAIGKAYSLLPFDAVELFDYAGVAYDLLHRLRQWQENPTINRPPFLPPHIPIVVRLHGSMQLIHQSEGMGDTYPSTLTPPPCSSGDDFLAWPLMYLMERYSIASAHAIFAQSKGMVSLYSQAYGLEEGQLTLAPPPMARVLAPFVGAAWGGGPWLNSTGFNVSIGSDVDPPSFRLLVYGRVARMKGAETVAAAVGVLRAALPPGVRLVLAFVGLDWTCSLHSRPTSACVEDAILDATRGSDSLTGGGWGSNSHTVEVSFEDPIDRANLPRLVAGFHGGIIASEFETFNLAAHELAACGLPLIISNIHAFREFFTPTNAYPFAVGNATSLAGAALKLYSDVVLGRARTARLSYGDPVAPYKHLIAKSRADPLGTAARDTSGLAVTDFAIGLQSRDCFESHACKKSWLGEEWKFVDKNSSF